MPERPHIAPTKPAGREFSLRNLGRIAAITIVAFVIMGYHPGLEDDSFYLAAVKWDLNPALFQHDADYFRIQFQATIFDKLIAFSSRLTHLSVPWVELLWQLIAIFFILQGCWRIARRCFVRPEAQWASVALIAALLTLPVSGIAINLADQYLHPRNLATAAILAAIVAVLDRRYWLAGILLAIALAIHVIMACFGISLCLFLAWFMRQSRTTSPTTKTATAVEIGVLLSLPFQWIFAPASDAWRKAASTRGFYYLGRWEWYEWLGVFAPLVLLAVFQRFLRQKRVEYGRAMLPIVSAVLYFGAFQTIVGLLLVLPPKLERVRPLEPMRYLHLVYVLFFLLVGGLIGQHILRRHIYRWVLLFIPLSSGMLYAQRQLYSSSMHLEMPFRSPDNAWLRAFDWIRLYTPADSVFAIDPHYETLPGEDYHGFRGLAECSVLADYEKDGGMAARVPPLAPRWLKEVTALDGWRSFQASDFERLKQGFGVTWIVLSRADAAFSAPPPSIVCPYANEDVKVCRLR